MEKGEIPPTAPLALIQRSCISRALPGRDQPQIQALLLHKQESQPPEMLLPGHNGCQPAREDGCCPTTSTTARCFYGWK